MSDKIYVRLRPVEKRKGYVCRRFVWRGNLFRAGEWRRVPAIVAEELAKMIQPRSEDNPKPLFDIGRDETEAQEIRKADEPDPSTEVEGALDLDTSAFRGLDEKGKEPVKADSQLLEPAYDEEDAEFVTPPETKQIAGKGRRRARTRQQ